MQKLVRPFPEEVSRRGFMRQVGFGFAAAVAGTTAAARTAGAQAVGMQPGRPDSLKFAILSDLHSEGDRKEYALAERMLAVRAGFPFEFVVTAGDNVNGRQSPRGFLDKFEKPFGGVLNQGVEFFAALGNHDDPSDRFYSPWNMGGNRYYTFARQNVRFFVLDSNDMDPVQVAWIDDALGNATEEWKICVLHHPPYSDGKTHGSQLDLRAIVEPLFVKHGVDVAFTGHDHIYERILPQQGIVWFVNGGAGPVRIGDTRPGTLTASHFDQDQSFMIAEVRGNELLFETITRVGSMVDSIASSKPA